MHKEQIDYIIRTKKRFPQFFENKNILDIGSFDVCGNEKRFFTNCEFIGLDIGPGENVDVICPAQEYDAPNEYFDTIISCECWEHNPFYSESIKNAIRMLKSGGFFIFTCATTDRPIHGTSSLEEESKKKFLKSVFQLSIMELNHPKGRIQLSRKMHYSENSMYKTPKT